MKSSLSLFNYPSMLKVKFFGIAPLSIWQLLMAMLKRLHKKIRNQKLIFVQISQSSMLIGSSYLASGDSDRFYICDITNTAFPNATPAFGMGNLYPEISSWGAFAGFKTIATFGGTNVVAYTNGVSVLSTNSWNGQGFQAGTVFIFSGGSSFSSKDTVSFYFIGNNSLNLARFSAAVNSLMGKFGCNKY